MKLRICLAGLLQQAAALSLTPFSPNTYWPGDRVPLSVNKLVSHADRAVYSYYDLPFVCPPKDGKTKATLSIDEILRGDRVYTSDFKLYMLEDEACHVLCTRQLDAESIKKANEYIRKDYKVEWYIDGLPGATSHATHDKSSKYYSSGFKLGQKGDNGQTYLNNHYTLVVKYRHSDNHDATRVVLAFEVYPRSIEMTENDKRSTDRRYAGSCELDALTKPSAAPGIPLQTSDRTLHESLNITYTYSVYFREDLDIHWVDRWNPYFYYSDTRIVWYSTIISAIICILLTSVVGVILARTLTIELRSGARPLQNDLELKEKRETAGWRLLHADIARPPQRPALLCSFVASGMQFALCLIALLIRHRISSSLGLFFLLFAGIISGHYSGQAYRSFDRDDWPRQGLLTALGIPGVFFILVVTLNICLWLHGGSVVPFGTLCELVGLWLGGSVPLVMIGVYTGTKSSSGDVAKTKTIPREIPRQPIITRFWPSVIIAGALPYAAICVELYFILQALQLHQDGYLSFIFRSLTLVLLIAVITNVEVTVTMMYLLLNHEDHQWHWKSFLYGSASAFYIFAHAMFYFLSRLQYGLLSGMVYFGYTVLFCLLYALVQGMLGYVVSSLFVSKIYSAYNRR